MALKTDHQTGESIKAADMNDQSVVINENQTGVLRNEHNILQLYLENFFASKVTPFLGLFFDGFSDVSKKDSNTITLQGDAASGQNILPSDVPVPFSVGDEITISGIDNEIGIISAIGNQEIVTLTPINDDFNRADSATVGGGWAESETTNIARISANRLLLQGTNLNATHTSVISQEVGVGKVTITGILNPFISNSPNIHFVSIVHKNNGVFGKGIGVRIKVLATSTLEFVDDDVQLSTQGFTFLNFTDHDFELIVNEDNSMEFRVWLSTDPKPITPTITKSAFTPTAIGTKVAIMDKQTSDNGSFRFDSIQASIDELKQDITLQNNLINNYLADDDLFRTTANINTVNKELEFSGSVDKIQNYYSIKQEFQQSMKTVRLWVVRNFTAQFNLDSAISAGATTLTILGDETGKFANGDTIDISTSNNLTRERKILTATPTFSGGVTTLTFSATVNAFTTSAFVERVDILPEISLVSSGDPESLQSMVFQRSEVDFANSEVEDEYLLTLGTGQEDLVVKLELTRNDTSLVPVAKLLGVSLNI